MTRRIVSWVYLGRPAHRYFVQLLRYFGLRCSRGSFLGCLEGKAKLVRLGTCCCRPIWWRHFILDICLLRGIFDLQVLGWPEEILLFHFFRMLRLLGTRRSNQVLGRLSRWRCVLRSYIARTIVLAATSALLAGIPVQILEVPTTTSKSTSEPAASRSATIVLLWRLLMLHTRSGILWRMVLWRVVFALWGPLRAIWLRVALIVVWRILSVRIY